MRSLLRLKNPARATLKTMKKIIRYIGSRCLSTKPLATGHSRPGSAAISLALALAATLPFDGWASEIVVPSDAIATVQAAVNAAAPGDTIRVLPGSYDEDVFVRTQGLKLHAETEAGAVAVTSFLVLAEDVEINGFDVSNGIMLIDSARGRVSNNSVSSSGTGIYVSGSPGAQIDHNTVDADSGILVLSCPAARVDHNKIDANYLGIYVEDSYGARVDHNRALGADGGGIVLWSSSAGRIEYNVAEGLRGIEVSGDSCGNAFEHNVGVGSEFGLYSSEGPQASCNSYNKNNAATAFPSLSFWGVK
jgi:parallel beta-helix repeat protein